MRKFLVWLVFAALSLSAIAGTIVVNGPLVPAGATPGTPGPAVYDNSARGFSNSAATSIATSSFAVSGSNRVIYAWVASGAGSPVAPTGVTWNGTPMTQQSSTQTVTAFGRSSLWRLIAPAATTSTCNATFGSAQDERLIVCISFTNADQTTPNGTIASATGTNFSISNTATTVSGDLVVDGAFFLDVNCQNYTFTIGGSQTQRAKIDGTDVVCEGLTTSTITASGTTQAMTWTVPTATGTLEWGTFAFAVKGF